MVGGVLVEREMCARRMVVAQVGGENPAQMAFAEYDDVIQAFSPDRSDDPFDVRILPRRAWGNQDVADVHAMYPSREVVPVDAIAVAQHIAREECSGSICLQRGWRPR